MMAEGMHEVDTQTFYETDLNLPEDDKVHLACLQNEGSLFGITCVKCKEVFIKYKLSSSDIKSKIKLISSQSPYEIKIGPSTPFKDNPNKVHIGCFILVTKDDPGYACQQCAHKLRKFSASLQLLKIQSDHNDQLPSIFQGGRQHSVKQITTPSCTGCTLF